MEHRLGVRDGLSPRTRRPVSRSTLEGRPRTALPRRTCTRPTTPDLHALSARPNNCHDLVGYLSKGHYRRAECLEVSERRTVRQDLIFGDAVPDRQEHFAATCSLLRHKAI